MTLPVFNYKCNNMPELEADQILAMNEDYWVIISDKGKYSNNRVTEQILFKGNISKQYNYYILVEVGNPAYAQAGSFNGLLEKIENVSYKKIKWALLDNMFVPNEDHHDQTKGLYEYQVQVWKIPEKYTYWKWVEIVNRGNVIDALELGVISLDIEASPMILYGPGKDFSFDWYKLGTEEKVTVENQWQEIKRKILE